jgi:hypothetical protein
VDLAELTRLLATTEDRPARMARVLYLDDAGEPAGFADVVGDPATVLDRLDTEGADGLAIQLWAFDGAVQVPAAVGVNRSGRWSLAVAGGAGAGQAGDGHAGDGPVEVALDDRVPMAEDPAVVASCWTLVIHALAALDRADAIPEPPDDPNPAAYLAAAWLGQQLAAAELVADTSDPVVRTGPEDDAGTALGVLELPDEAGLVKALGLDGALAGWDAVHAAVADARADDASRLGRNGVAWHAHDLLGDPGRVLGALAAAGHVDTADRIFATMIDRGWVRPVS